MQGVLRAGGEDGWHALIMGILPNVLTAGSKREQTKEGWELDSGQEARGHPVAAGAMGEGTGVNQACITGWTLHWALYTFFREKTNCKGKMIVLIYR